MRILVYSGERTGSYSLCKWISSELGLKFLTELEEWNPEMDEVVVKRSVYFRNNPDYFDIHSSFQHFDKIVLLYRNDVVAQSESTIFAERRKKWHHTNDMELDGYYTIDNTFLKENERDIVALSYKLEKDKDFITGLDYGLKISYEELYGTKAGELKMYKYLDIIPTLRLNNPELKLRKEADKKMI
jgi:hypothetical protein